MKKSKIAKLALMGASITALAATLTTSTYAWYVSNRQADVTGGTGTTGAAGSDGSVLVSWTGGNGDVWFKSIDFADDADAVRNALAPIHFDSSDFYGIATDGTKPASASTSYIKFDIYVKTGAATTVTPTLTLSATGSNTQKAYVGATSYVKAKTWESTATYYTLTTTYSAATPTSANFAEGEYYTRTGEGTAGDPYVYVKASTFVSTATYYTKAETGTEANDVTASNYMNYYFKCENCLPTTTTVEKGQSFSVDPLKAIYVKQDIVSGNATLGSTQAATSYYCQDTTASGGDAHAYYTAVTGYLPWATTAPSAAGLSTFNTTADTQVKLTYTIYLDGADLDCYNSCAGYNLAFDLKFEI